MNRMSRSNKNLVCPAVLPLLVVVIVGGCSEASQGQASGQSSDSSATTSGTSASATSTAASTSAGGSSTGGATSTGASGASSAPLSTGGGASGTSSGSSGTSSGASGGTQQGDSNGTSGASGSTSTSGATTQDSSASSSGSETGSTQDSESTAPGSGTFHVFMLMGQSNMAGVAKFEESDKNTDERIKVLGGCNQPAGQWNLANPPLSDCPGEKGWNLSDSVDPGIWFAKTIVEKLPAGDTIGLVGTAESGESINTFVSGGSHHQMILNKIATAKMAENARFAGVIFHQGESDSGQSTWPDKVVQLYNEVKQAWGADYDVPFILGELPAGGCCSGHNTQVHAAADKLPMGYWISQEGTNVMDEYHFDHASVVLMGQRYGEKMIEALGW